MNLELDGKVALIGGSSKGLGKGCALELAKEGVHLVITGRNTKVLEKTAASIRKKYGVRVLPFTIDLSDNSMIKNLVIETINEFKRIDILVINSGGPSPGSFFEIESDDWKKSHDLVFGYALEFYHHILPVMKKQKWGRIIIISSLSVKEPNASLILSNVYRSAVLSLSKSISKGLLPYNITVNTVLPGAFKTDRAIQLMEKDASDSNLSLKDIEAKNIKNLPLGRYQDSSELGYLVVFLSSEKASGITGTSIPIDGGLSNGLL